MPSVALSIQLAFFGEIDKEVTKARKTGNSEVVDMVQTLLPGTAGFGQNGWFPELKQFVNSKDVRSEYDQVEFLDFEQALSTLMGVTPMSGALPPIATPSDRGQPDELAAPALARTTFGSMVLAKIYEATGRHSVATAMTRVAPTLLESWAPLRAMSERNGPPNSSQNLLPPDFPSDQEALMQAFAAITDRTSWRNLLHFDPEFAERSLPCFGTLQQFQGRYCTAIYTYVTDPSLTVADIKAVIEPSNWNVCFPWFFCAMRDQNPNTCDGWTRLSERVSAECKEYGLDTALIFWKKETTNGLFINYALDSDRQQDSMIVDIDNGYLWVEPLSAPGTPGVRIRTSKQELINGLSPTATAALGCLMGWADSSRDMLIGAARLNKDGMLRAPDGTPVDPASFTESEVPNNV